MNIIKLFFVKMYLFFGRKKYESIKKVKFSDGKTKEVIIYKGKFPGAQMVLFLNVILLEKSLFNKYSLNVQRYVIEHEYAHFKLRWLNVLIILPLFYFSLLGIISLFSILIFTISFLLHQTKATLMMFHLKLFLLSVFVFGAISWSMELHADISAIKRIGLQETKQVYEEVIKKKQKRNIFFKILGHITHPPKKLTIWIYEKLFNLKSSHQLS